MVKSPGWLRRALLTCAALGLVGLVLPSTVEAPRRSSELGTTIAAGSPAPTAGRSGLPVEATSPPTSLDDYVAASPAATPATSSVPVVSAPAGATPVRITPDHPACGRGYTAQEVLGDDPFGVCTHTFNDPAPTRSPKNGAARMAPICHGNGVNGARIQLIYMYIEGQPNRGPEWIPRIVNEWVPAMEGAFRVTSTEQGREIGMRLHMPGCKIEVTTVEISEDEGAADGGQFSRIVNRVRNSGINATDRKFHVWFDGPAKGPCGTGQALLVPGAGDNPTPANAHNFGYDFALVPQVAVSFRLPFPLHDWQKAPPMCWGSGAMGAMVEVHEVLHTLGAVNSGSPNSNQMGHCTDDLDIMCYSEGGVETVPRCAIEVEALDCGADDYFNARPPLGSYLSYSWNTANSRYLGPATLEDSVPIEIPRP